jgi:hypothetical protein
VKILPKSKKNTIVKILPMSRKIKKNKDKNKYYFHGND